VEGRGAWEIDRGLDLDGFLTQPLVARVATAGPTLRPIWFLWEQERFWWLTGDWSRLAGLLERDPRVVLVVDTCDLDSGRVVQVTASGRAAVVPFDAGRARRKLLRYLGPDEERWDERFRSGTFGDQSTRLVCLEPATLRARDLSFAPGRR
jgi:nitroimidazol reductase NimA-like FMN-containing flavoprotein (pyridoxamine 5'-phosphate oxidase superfamily)